MSLFGYPDFDRPLAMDVATVFESFATGEFWLAPHRCAVANPSDGRVDFCLDLMRSISPRSANGAYAILECRVAADYALDGALSRLRRERPRAVLSRCVLTNWAFRLEAAPLTIGGLEELQMPTLLASDGLGSARLVVRLPIESGLLLETLLRDGDAPLRALAEAEVAGVSPRVPAVVRWHSSTLLPRLAALVDAETTLPRQAIVDFFTRDVSALPLEITGDIPSDGIAAFGETMADRIVGRFGRFVPSIVESLEPCVRLDLPEDDGGVEFRWSLSQPFLTSRRLLLPIDLLSDVRRRIPTLGIDTFVRRQTAATLPRLGEIVVSVVCNLPAERVGVAEIGVRLVFPADPPHRPDERRATVVFDARSDIVDVQVQLAPGERGDYQYSTFVVVADEHGTREVTGPLVPHSGTTLKLSPEDFPVDFFQIEVAPGLAAIAAIEGQCRYERDGRTFSVPFTLDSGRLAASIAVPRERTSASVVCTAISRDGLGALDLGPFEVPRVRLDLFSFAEYGAREIEMECRFDGGTSVCAIDVLAADPEDASVSPTTLAFTAAGPVRRFRWFARSPFQPGFRYRSHRDDGSPAPWHEVTSPGERLVIRASDLGSAAPTEAVAVSERAPRAHGAAASPRTSEAGAADEEKAVIPVSPEAEPTDVLLYSDPERPEKKYFLPHYALDVQQVSGQQRYRIAMTQQGATAKLTIHLLAAPAPSVADVARDAEEFPHTVAIRLEFLQSPPSGAIKSLPFEEVARNGSIVTASVTFATLQERDEVFAALTREDRRAQLIVKRVIDVSLPQTPRPPPRRLPDWVLRGIVALPPRPIAIRVFRTSPTAPAGNVLATGVTRSAPILNVRRVHEAGPIAARARMVNNTLLGRAIRHVPVAVVNLSLPVPEGAFIGTDTGTDGQPAGYALGITNWKAYSADLFQAAGDLPPCGANANASRTWLNVYDADTGARLYSHGAVYSPGALAEVRCPMPSGGELPQRMYVELLDRRTESSQRSAAFDTRVPQAATPSYAVAHRELDQAVDPATFAFDRDVHGYMFQGITAGGGGAQLVRFRVAWNERFHTYLQDAARPETVYFLPDAFKIARRPEPPFAPFVTVRVLSKSGLSDTEVVVDYIVSPYTNPKRLADAQAVLLKDPAFGGSSVRLQPFFTTDVRFFIDRPTHGGTSREERSDASLVLQGALKDTLTMPIADFDALFTALHRETASMFLGRVEIGVPKESAEVIPFTGRMDDLEGEMFLYGATARADGSIDVTMTNAIESPVQINVLDALVTAGGQTSTGRVESSVVPLESLPPGESVQVHVIPETALGGSAAPEVKMYLEGVSAKADPAAVWDAILDRTSVRYFRTIAVTAIPNLFEPIAERPQDQIVMILVEFEGGGTAELRAEKLEAEVEVDYPVDDVILRRSISSVYRYTTTVVRADNRQERDASPREGADDRFAVIVAK